ncbi:MAG: DMT family transporter [Rhizobiales bacterium]|nr:DMT family transporter [Hyphomicrobiales bacterium]
MASMGFTPSYRVGVILVLLAGACWSSMGIGIRLMLEAQVWQILFYRSLALAPFLFIVIAFRSGGKPVSVIRSAGLPGVIGGFALVTAFAGGIASIQLTTVANAMFLFAAAPFMAAVLGWLVLGESVRTATWAAMAVAIIGIVIMVRGDIVIGDWLGSALALLAGFGFAVFTIALRFGRSQDMMPAIFLSGVFAVVIAGVANMLAGQSLAVPVNDIAIAMGLGVFQLGAGLTIFTIGSKVVPAAELALLAMTEVLLGPIWVWLFLGETASFSTLAGGSILLLAIAGNAVSGLRRKPGPLVLP